MRTATIEITLQDEIVLSERSATEGGHQSLDFIPGSTLLGAVAAKLYARHQDKAHLLFHSGALRFGNAYPVINGRRALPCPLSLHYDKQNKGSIRNYLQDRFEDKIQPKQMRTGFVVIDGARLQISQPRLALRMKTAIDTATGHVKDGQLYGYQSLLAGQSFLAKIESDELVPEDLWQEVLSVLTDGVRIGRSKAQQYGRARCQIQNPTIAEECAVSTAGNKLVIWTVSDMAVLDENGMPCLVPHSASLLGLPAGRLNCEQSFIRTRRYSAYNSYRKSYDSERLVIQQGSILTFELDAPLSLANPLPSRIGLLQEAGLGEVIYNPDWALQAQPFHKVHDVPESQIAIRPAGCFLLDWLEARHQGAARQSNLLNKAEAWLTEYLSVLRSAVSYQALDANLWHGPSAAQWGRVEEKAKQYQGLDQLCQALFNTDDAVCKTVGRTADTTSTETREGVSQDWGLQIDGDITLAKWLEGILKAADAGPNVATILAMLAGKIQQQIKSGAPQYPNSAEGAQQ